MGRRGVIECSLRTPVRAFRPNQSIKLSLARGPPRLRRTIKTRQKVQPSGCKDALTGPVLLIFIVRQSIMTSPVPYDEWRKDAVDRAEDAASNFGFYLMAHCRAEALKK